MQARSIEGRAAVPGERRAPLPGRAAILAAAVLAGGCIADPPSRPVDAAPAAPDAGPPVAPDAAPDRYAVRGSAIGVLVPVALELRLGEDIELLSVTQEGTFAFEARVDDGASYTVTLVSPGVPCTLRNATGVITGADTDIELMCTGASLASVTVSGIDPVITIVPGTIDYVVDLPLQQTSATLTATVAQAGDTLAIAGVPVASGEPSDEIPLSLGDNVVDIVVENALGWQRTYRMNLRRAPELAQYAYGKASNAEASDQFGYRVALSGDTLAVSTPSESGGAEGVNGNDNNFAFSSGAVYVFRRTGSAWQQEAYVKPSNTGELDHFGQSLALSGDTLAVGAPHEGSAARGVGGNQDDDSVRWSGAVYVFRRTGSVWQQEAYVKASNTGAFDQFGQSVALSGDILAVGADFEDSATRGVGGDQDDNEALDSGAVYVFRRTGSIWQQEAYVKASNAAADDRFGFSVALSGDTLAVGAQREDSAAQGVGGDQDDNAAIDSGAVYVFRHTGSAWRQEAYLKASNTGASDFFGYSVALSANTLAVGARFEDSAAQGVGGDQDDNAATDSGAVYVFRRIGTTWQQEAYVKASNTAVYDDFGYSVALSGDTLAVGAGGEDSAARGVGGDQDDNAVTDSGAAYVFRRAGTAWRQRDYVKASNTGASDSFGYSVALSGNTLAVGAPLESSAAQGVDGNQDDDSASYSGAVYVFE